MTQVVVYERKASKYVLISKFEAEDGAGAGAGGPRPVIRVVYGGRCHYDAVELT